MSSPQPGWYADPYGRPVHRWWDGGQWTEHTQEPPAAAGPQYQQAQYQAAQYQQAPYQQPQTAQQYQPQAPAHDPARVQRQVHEQAGVHPTGPGGGTLFSEPVLVVNQKAKLIELTNEYAVLDANGGPLGSVVQVGQSGLKKAMRFVSSLDQFMTHRLEVRDAYGTPQLILTRPAKFVKSTVIVARPDGQEIGKIVQQNAFGKIRFDFETPYGSVGGIQAENWRAWNFAVTDHTGGEVARITKTWEGLAKTMFTSADNYVVQIHRPLADPLLSMVVAAGLAVDTALKQDSRGFN